MQAVQEQPKTPDWDYIQTRYLQGATPKELALETGVKADRISVHATRKGWTHNLRRTAQSTKVEVTVKQEPKADSQLAKQSEAVRNALGRDLKRVCDLLETKTPSSVSGALKRQQDMESLVRNAKTVFGWSDSSNSPSVRIAILGDATIQSEPTGPTPPHLIGHALCEDKPDVSKSQTDP